MIICTIFRTCFLQLLVAVLMVFAHVIVRCTWTFVILRMFPRLVFLRFMIILFLMMCLIMRINNNDCACARYVRARKKYYTMDTNITVSSFFRFLAALHDKFAVRFAFSDFTMISLSRRCFDSVREFRCEIPSTSSDFRLFKQRISTEFDLQLGSVMLL